MKVKFKRIDKSLPLPIYHTAGAVAFDLMARVDMTVEPRGLALIPANLIVQIPAGYALLVASRSSTPRKHGLSMPHGIGVIDQDYCGEGDELLIQVFNFTDKPVIVNRGTRVAQGLFVRTDRAEFEEVETLEDKTRGGFGSTG